MFQTNLRKVRLTAEMWPVFLEEISNTDPDTQLSLLHLDECWPPDNAIDVNIINSKDTSARSSSAKAVTQWLLYFLLSNLRCRLFFQIIERRGTFRLERDEKQFSLNDNNIILQRK